MDNQLVKVFENPDFGQVRVVEKDGEPWFVAADVCRALDIRNNRDALIRLDADEKGVGLTDTLGGKQESTIVNEPGLYSLVLGSRKPEAKAFKRWITHEVIPSIRKHGAYMTPDTLASVLANPENMAQVLMELAAERKKNITLTAQAEENKPKVVFADAVSVAKSSILIGDLAKLIKQNGVDIGQNRLFDWMRRNGYLIKDGASKNMPTQKSMNNGWFEVKVSTVVNSDGSIRETKTTKVTGKGQQYFVNLWLAEKKQQMEMAEE